ncbi:HTH-type transcriptional activator CmpR [Marinobacterium sp. xm-a-121]|uniref:LysR family transcriptional regulator n=1 Tax=unclassified Marinobacterium TaxID=2644139 RepID=UPI001568DDC8|nr:MULTISPECIES: LysR family transcriptional regulator [unclassified Marinobacterium]NRP38595.1 HTH-type transcriptional activator CmpR [Marinobacterium sp. xm-a-121]NRP94972.1 HTH-type transcriptional activator CmpR [Marinobacterium sp. xm-g-59]NRP99411.1 HTH-type transcriptional activator CmpR [Marinobacterium sp. xm-v-233]
MKRPHSHIGTIRQLEILLSVYKHGSITAAANVLHLSQPTLSMQLNKLSDSVGTALYSVVGKRIVFTEAGHETIKSAREIIDSLERLDMRISNLQDMKTGTLRLAAVTTAKYLAPHLIGDFVKEYPGISVDFKIGNRGQMIQTLSEGESDFFIFSHQPDEPDLILHRFAPNYLVPVVDQHHSFPSHKKMTIDEFAKEPFIARELGSGTQLAIDEHFKQLGIKPNIRMTVASNEAIKHFIMSGLGVSILPRHSLILGGALGLREIQVEHLPVEADWYLGYFKGRELSVVAQTFLDYALSQQQNAEIMLEPAFMHNEAK